MLKTPLVCVIDDDPSLRKALIGLIASMGYRCCGYASAEGYLASGDVEFVGCILSDIQMPGLDGFAFKEILDAGGCRAGFIMMTARSEVHLERRALEAGAVCFLRKPLCVDQLATCLERAVVLN
ncbi:response regulator transcription factor [Acidisphaera sp. L21]|uniref:response regulator transcription factor n=1 Tax=Acidisphaera sp. L21 TaxID=1641851 RepID=UPI00131CDC97|nr:response regulator [Acidisphaera sp. L21]